jgi:hypothetical protein
VLSLVSIGINYTGLNLKRELFQRDRGFGESLVKVSDKGGEGGRGGKIPVKRTRIGITFFLIMVASLVK